MSGPPQTVDETDVYDLYVANRASAVLVADEVVSVAGAEDNTFFVKKDGSLWAMGSVRYPGLGVPASGNGSLPIEVAAGVARASGASAETAVDATGTTRYRVARRVSVPAGASAMVTVLHERVPGRAVLLFDPRADVSGAGEHPLRVAHLRNTVGGDAGVELVAGPVTLFGGGELLGEGLLDALPAGRSVFVPYGLDASTNVRRSPKRSVFQMKSVLSRSVTSQSGSAWRTSIGTSRARMPSATSSISAAL